MWVLCVFCAMLSFAQPDTTKGPRLGRYDVLQGNSILYFLDLAAGGKYKLTDPTTNKKVSEGEYTYDHLTEKVTWKGGLFEKEEYGGNFRITDGGKTHFIRLTREIYAINEKGKK